MALRIWIPFNGDDINRGVSGAMASTVTAGSYSTGGKVCAKCLANGVRSIPYSFAGTSRFSVALWVKPNSATAWTDMFGWGTGASRIEITANGGTEYRYYCTSGGSLVTSGTVISTSLANGAWCHFAMVADGTNVRFYIDGSLVKTATQVQTITSTFGTDNTIWVGGFPNRGTFNSYINDFRVYDHALSMKEVKELSMGLAMHIPFFGEGYPGVGQNIAISSWRNMASRSIGQYYDRLLYDAGFFGLSAGEQYTYTVKLTAPSDRSVAARVQYFTSDGDRINIVGNYVPAGTTGYSYITETLTSEQRGKSRMELNIQNGDTSLTSAATYYVGEVKLERGDHSTAWSPHAADVEHGPDYGITKETTGNASITVSGSPTAISSGPRYGMCAHFNGGDVGETGDYIEYTPPSGLTGATLMTWVYIDDTMAAYPALDIKKGNPTGDLWLALNTENVGVWAYYGGIYNSRRGTMFSPGEWHHVAFVWNAGITQWYVDGEVQGSSVDMSSKSTTWPATTHTIGSSYSGSSWSGAKLKARLSDWRFYSTALGADDIRNIVKAPVSFTDNGEVHCGALVERPGHVSVEKSALVKCSAVSEIYGRFDNQTHIEPDGSAWVRIVHHADPTTYRFASSDSFGTWVYRDERRWFHGKMCDYTDRWEFMIIQKGDGSASTMKYRWVQTKNPNTAAWGEVASANITKNTGPGYTTFSTGGLYKINSNTFYCANNGNEGNWWGAVGAWNSHNGGIPAWASVIVKDGGFEDLYIRVDGGANWSFPTNDRVSIIKSDNSLTEFGVVEV